MTTDRTCGIVLTTTGDEETARTIARALVERRLAACVNVVSGVRSIYRWEGSISEDEERLLIVKTSAERFEEVRRAIRELHGYKLPEIVFLPLSNGDAEYLRWLDASIDPAEPLR